jgi:dipeptidase D
MDTVIANMIERLKRINAIPRCSKKEGRLAAWLQRWAADHRLEHRSDTAGNIVVTVPASPGFEAAPTVVFQGHMDMVCEKMPDSAHDFDRDPIEVIQRDEWLCAEGTTLGADNGIGLAYALALVEEPAVLHPPLELLFTVDEETGLNGAKALAQDFVSGRLLLNADSEEEGVLTVGCAGGLDTRITAEFDPVPLTPGSAMAELTLGGLMGGHSGVDIHKHRASANSLMARLLGRVRREAPLGLVRITGGSRPNAISRDASALISVDTAILQAVRSAVADFEKIARAEYPGERDLFVRMRDGAGLEPAASATNVADSDRLVHLLLALPHGVAGMSQEVADLVETSSNLAQVRFKGKQLEIITSQRSSSASRIEEISGRIQAAAALAGARCINENAYPAWPPDMTSALLRRSREAYRHLYRKDPQVRVIHAGLECAIIGSTYPGMDMISFGPTIRNAHSPDEQLHIPSIGRVWDWITALLRGLR